MPPHLLQQVHDMHADLVQIAQFPAQHVRDTLGHMQGELHLTAEHTHSLVFKVGRTTGVTLGRLNGTEVLTRHTRWTWPPTGQGAKAMGEEVITVMEHAVMPVAPADCNSDAHFAHHGDSGALIYNTRFQPVGLLFGGFRTVSGCDLAQACPLEDHDERRRDDDDHGPCEIAMSFHKPGVDLKGASLYTPIDVVLASMHLALSARFGEKGFRLVIV